MKHLILALFCVLTPLGAWTLLGADSTTPSSKPKAAPAAPGVDAQRDKTIEAAIRAKLTKSKIGKDGFHVRVQGGVAYWTGSTTVLQHKGAATRMAKACGARMVVNSIVVSDAAKQKAADNLTQGPRPAQMKRSEPRSQQ